MINDVIRYGPSEDEISCPTFKEGPSGPHPSSACETLHAKQQGSQDMMGSTIVQCEKDGTFSNPQCSGSTGYCWCVDIDGVELSGTSLGPGAERTCAL